MTRGARKIDEDLDPVLRRLHERGVEYADIAYGFGVSTSLIAQRVRGERAVKVGDKWQVRKAGEHGDVESDTEQTDGQLSPTA